MKEKIISILYPRRCPVCDEIVHPKGAKICSSCRADVPFISEPRCKKCSKPVENEYIEYCYDCEKGKHIYKKGLALVEHKGKIRKSIYSIKYKNRREYLDFYAKELVDRYLDEIKSWNADVIIPVPMFSKKEVKRGFNQATEAAVRLGKLTGIPVENNTLIRKVNTLPQKELTDTQRRKNVENAFHVRENIVKLKRIILVDDIYTTGSTIDACTKVLLEAGAEKVFFLSLSIGDGL